MIVENPLTDDERGVLLRLVLMAATVSILGNPHETTDTKERNILLRIASKLSGNPTQLIARHHLPDPPQSS